MKRLHFKPLLPCFIFFTLLTLLVCHNGFFWDTQQLGSRHAYWYYETNFTPFFLPDAIDSGHPPLLGILLAVSWKIFGMNLPVSHFLMLPFLFGIILQLHKFLRYFFSSENILPAMILILADATFLAQACLVSPDIILVFFFLLSLNAVLYERPLFLLSALILLSLTSTRGMLLCAGIFFFDILISYSKENNIRRKLFTSLWIYIPASIPAVAFLYFHYMEKGWLGYYAGSPWAPAFQRAEGPALLKNMFILGWRLIDFGRIFLWLFLICFLSRYKGHIWKTDARWRQLVKIFVSIFFVSCPTFLLYENLNAHRYILPLIMLFSILAAYLLLEKMKNMKFKKTAFYLLLLALLSGNFWVYPDRISKGWDATLAHLPYYDLREDMITFMDANNIPVSATGSAFPMLEEFRYFDLSEDTREFAKKDMDHQQYILFSNISNDFTTKEITALKSDWYVVHALHRGQVRMTLYENPAYLP